MATVTFHNGVRTQHAWYSGSAAGVIQRWWRAIRDRMVIRKLINIIRGVEGGNVLNRCISMEVGLADTACTVSGASAQTKQHFCPTVR